MWQSNDPVLGQQQLEVRLKKSEVQNRKLQHDIAKTAYEFRVIVESRMELEDSFRAGGYKLLIRKL